MPADDIDMVLRERPADAHKGVFGKALICAGSYGMAGAAVLGARACLRSGVGLCYVCVPERCLNVLKTAVPEAVISFGLDNLSVYDAVGCGPGLGRTDEAVAKVSRIIANYGGSLLLDADALNIISEKGWQHKIPRGAVLTPHPVEFARLTGVSGGRDTQIDEARKFAAKYGVTMVLKGAGTVVAGPEGEIYTNNTGNSGMATGGSGDVLSGLITGLMAQGYKPYDAACLGVRLHGMAGDIAAEKKSGPAMIAGDIVENIGEAFKRGFR